MGFVLFVIIIVLFIIFIDIKVVIKMGKKYDFWFVLFEWYVLCDIFWFLDKWLYDGVC